MLQDVVVVPGVRVSGRIGISGTADLRVAGAVAARGRLRLDGRGHLIGRLGGRPIHLRPRGRSAGRDASQALDRLGWRPPPRRRAAFSAR